MHVFFGGGLFVLTNKIAKKRQNVRHGSHKREKDPTTSLHQLPKHTKVNYPMYRKRLWRTWFWIDFLCLNFHLFILTTTLPSILARAVRTRTNFTTLFKAHQFRTEQSEKSIFNQIMQIQNCHVCTIMFLGCLTFASFWAVLSKKLPEEFPGR